MSADDAQSPLQTHRYVTTQWRTAGYSGRFSCVCCGFDIIGENRALEVAHKSGRKSAHVCDGCVAAIAAVADGWEIRMDGDVRKAAG